MNTKTLVVFPNKTEKDIFLARQEAITATLALVGIAQLCEELLFGAAVPSFIILIFAALYWIMGVLVVKYVRHAEEDDEGRGE